VYIYGKLEPFQPPCADGESAVFATKNRATSRGG